MSKRKFSRPQRNRIFLASGGRCAICGAVLDQKWHADHIMPFAAGGPSELENGQALCPLCNLKKSGSLPDISLKPFQECAVQKVHFITALAHTFRASGLEPDIAAKTISLKIAPGSGSR